MKKDIKVELKKLKSVENPFAPTPKMEDYKPGQDNGFVSLPTDYTAEGTLEQDIIVDQPVIMHRTKRNGIESVGILITSKVKRIVGNRFYTENSVYQVTELE
jgi:hypothetical protein